MHVQPDADQSLMTQDTDKTREQLLEEIARLKQEMRRVKTPLAELAPLPYHSLDAEGRIVQVNQAWVDTFGYSRDEVLDTWIGIYLTAESKAILPERFARFVKQGNIRNAEFTMIHRDGSRLLVTVNGRIEHGPGGEFARTHCILTDITERRRAEEQVAMSEAQFRGLFESSMDGILFADVSGNILNVNPQFCLMLGRTREELLGRHVRDITPERWWETESSQAIKQVFEQGYCDEFRKEYHHARGHIVPVSTRLWLHRDDGGNPLGVWGIARDITEPLRAEKALKESERQYRRMVETANEAILGLDTDLKIVFANHVALGFLGYDMGQLLGRDVRALFRPDDLSDLSERYAQIRNGRSERFESAFLRNDRSVAWGLVSVTPLLSEGGEYTGSFAMITDIGDRKRAEAELARSERYYRDIFERSVEGLYQSTPEGRFVAVNSTMARILGYGSPEDLTESVNDIADQLYVDSTDRQRLLGRLDREDKVNGYECRLHRKDGRMIWVSENGRAIRDESGRVSMYEGSVVDVTERKEAEEALRLTQFSVDNAPTPIYWVTKEGEFLYVNDQACDSLGYTKEEMLGMTVADINPSLQAEAWRWHWEERRSMGSRRFESVHQRKDGSEFPVGITSHYCSHGGVEYLFIYAYDLTEREEADKAIRRSQELLNEVQRMSLTGGWDVDLESGDMYWTDGQFQLHGLEPGPPVRNMQEYFEKYVHPEDRRDVAGAWHTIMKEQVPAQAEYRVVRADGSEAILISAGIPELDEHGNLVRIYGSNRDVTAERRAAEELKQSHNRLLTILDGIDADIYVSDLETDEVMFMNAHMRSNFGAPAEQAFCYEVFRGETEPCSFCPKPELRDEQGLPVETIVCERYNPLTGRWYLNHDRAIEWLEGRLAHMHMAADITELKGMEKHLKQAMAEAEGANIAKNEFLANMSHEIRTPLNGLLGMLQLLQLTNLGEEQVDYLNTAMNSGRNLLQILNDILDLSKIESGKLELEHQEMELSEVLHSVVSVFRHQAETRGVHISWEVDRSLPRHFLADEGRLRQILFNLVGNATKFTESGTIRVEACPLDRKGKDGRTVLFFTVTDTGIGIPDDKVARIFDPFTQVDGSFTRKYQGTGLGLGIVRRLVTLMGGNIAVLSELGKGTTIVFTLTVNSSEVHQVAAQEKGAEEAARPLSILVAEDEMVNRMVVQRLLGKLGHDVVCVENGEAAVEALREESFDCVLTDIQMPGMDGLQTTRVIREELGLDLPVVALTAHAMKGDRGRFLEAGMDGYLSKPFELKELREELKRVMAPFGPECA